MANLTVRKVSTGSTVLSGLKTSRYEKAEVAYGVIEAADYTLGDTIVFDGVRSKEIIKGTVTIHTATPVVLDILPATVLTSALVMETATKAKVSYVIDYIRGEGRVGTSTTTGDLLKVTINEDV